MTLLPVGVPLLAAAFIGASSNSAHAQQKPSDKDASTAGLHDELQRLALAVTEAQVQLAASQKRLSELQDQILRLQSRTEGALDDKLAAKDLSTPPPQSINEQLAARIDDLRERQDVQQAEIATHELSKVETESKYPLQVSGLVLMNAFTNTHGVDSIQVPSLAVDGAGSTGASFRQTILGIDGRGPHIFGAKTHADLRVDFFGGQAQSSYGAASGLLRLRTAHVLLDWKQTEAFAQFDSPIFSPNTPTSLTTMAEPPLSWSGNLWTWLPQAGLTQRFALGDRSQLKVQVGLMDVPDPPTVGAALSMAASLAEQSRWPGSEARVAFGSRDEQRGAEIGLGGYFSPHHLGARSGFDAWAGTADFRLPLPAHLEVSGSFYRGLALGGLGGGAYKDYVYRVTGNTYSFRALDDVGGWTQLKARLSERLQVNAAFGLDSAFAGEVRPFTDANSGTYASLVRNQTVFTNAIYSPSAATLFSFEYRHIASSPATGTRYDANILGVAAGYKF